MSGEYLYGISPPIFYRKNQKNIAKCILFNIFMQKSLAVQSYLYNFAVSFE